MREMPFLSPTNGVQFAGCGFCSDNSDSGGSGGSSGIDIDTTETKIGKYLGKDLYVKVIENVPMSSSQWNNYSGDEKVICAFVEGVYSGDGVLYSFPVTFGYAETGSVYRASQSYLSSGNMTIFYTKGE